MARERRKFQVGRSENRKLHRGHFAFMRALVEGLEVKPSWKRYLEFEGNVADERVIRSTIAWIRGEFAAAARPRTGGELFELVVGRSAPSNHSFERHGFAASLAWGSAGGTPPTSPTRE